MPLGWAGASPLSYFSVLYYHNGYLLEAAFPLSFTLGILAVRVVKSIGAALERMNISTKKAATVFVCILAVGAAAVSIGAGRIPVVRKRIELVRISIDSNRNFKSLMRYLSDDLHENAVIFELDEEQLGTTSMDRRFLPLHERASVIKIMNIRDQHVMLRVLDREDIRIYPSLQINESGMPEGAYFLALNAFERRIAELRYDLELIAEFRGDLDCAAIHTLTPGAD